MCSDRAIADARGSGKTLSVTHPPSPNAAAFHRVAVFGFCPWLASIRSGSQSFPHAPSGDDGRWWTSFVWGREQARGNNAPLWWRLDWPGSSGGGGESPLLWSSCIIIGIGTVVMFGRPRVARYHCGPAKGTAGLIKIENGQQEEVEEQRN